MSDTVTITVPRSAVETLQRGDSVDSTRQAIRAVRRAILDADLPAPAIAPGTVFTDTDGDLWIVGPNGKAGLVIINAGPDFGAGSGGRQDVRFTNDTFDFVNDEDFTLVYDPTAEAEGEPQTVRDCEGDLWERTSSGVYRCTTSDAGGMTYVELAREYPDGFGPLNIPVAS
jgi:hypothetical protein